MQDKPMCAHLKVEYRPDEHSNGTKSDRWRCLSCGGDFWPQYWLFTAPWLREAALTPAERESHGNCDLVSRPHLADCCGKAWRPLCKCGHDFFNHATEKNTACLIGDCDCEAYRVAPPIREQAGAQAELSEEQVSSIVDPYITRFSYGAIIKEIAAKLNALLHSTPPVAQPATAKPIPATTCSDFPGACEHIPPCEPREVPVAKAGEFDARALDYEQNYILPCFTWAKEYGIDLQKLVVDNPGKNCVELLVRTLAAGQAAQPEGEAEQHRSVCEQCNRSMVGENAVCLTCWNRVASQLEGMRGALQALVVHIETRQVASVTGSVRAELAEVKKLIFAALSTASARPAPPAEHTAFIARRWVEQNRGANESSQVAALILLLKGEAPPQPVQPASGEKVGGE